MTKAAHLLVIRLSSLGDVAMTVPVVKALVSQYPHLKITFLSKPFHQFLFDSIPQVSFIGFDEKEYKGFWGTFRFWWKNLRPLKFTQVVDLHDVLRSKVLLKLFVFTTAKTSVFRKGRSEKKRAVKEHTANTQPLQNTVVRYQAAFEKFGFLIRLDASQWIPHKHRPQGVKMIGIAPLAKHFTKTYPLDRMRALIADLLQEMSHRIVLFGGKEDRKVLQSLLVNEQVEIADCPDMTSEMHQIAQLDVMISMDSANMHLASLVEVPVVSIWGGTHPNIGFYGYRQDPQQAIQVDLPCRPCSVFGRGDCPEGHFKCMKEISHEEIMRQVDKLLA